MREEGEEASKRRSADAQMSRKREKERERDRERAGINSLGETHCRCNVNPNY